MKFPLFMSLGLLTLVTLLGPGFAGLGPLHPLTPALRSTGTTGVPSPRAILYPVTFTEKGLPAGNSWEVEFNGTNKTATTTSIVFSGSNGTHAYNIYGVPGWHQSSLSYFGNITVTGNPYSVPTLQFVRVTYSVIFNESGLAPGTNWSVTYNGSIGYSTNSTVGFAICNGTFTFSVTQVPSYFAAPSSGYQNISGGPVTKPIHFNLLLPSTYNVTFSENGLAAGIVWGVVLGNSSLATISSSVSTRMINGTYQYTISVPHGYTVSPSSGTFTVQGSAQLIVVNFSQVTLPPGVYILSFSESGLPNGTVWQVSIASTTMSSSVPEIQFQERNGTYDYTVGLEYGYNATPVEGNASVQGQPVTIFILFTVYNPNTTHSAQNPSAPPSLLGLPVEEAYLLIAVLIVLVLAAVLYAARSGPREEEVPPARAPPPRPAPAPEPEVPAAPAPPEIGHSTGVPVSVVEASEVPTPAETPLSTTCPVCRVPLSEDNKCNICGVLWTERDLREAQGIGRPLLPTETGTASFEPETAVHHTETDADWEKQMGALQEQATPPPAPPPAAPEPAPEPQKPVAAPFLLALRTGRTRKPKKKKGSRTESNSSGPSYVGFLPLANQKGSGDEEEEQNQ